MKKSETKSEQLRRGVGSLLQKTGPLYKEEKTIDEDPRIEEDKEPSTRYTYRARRESLEKLRALAYFDRESVTDFIEKMCKTYFSQVGEEKIQEALQAYNTRQKSRRPKQ